MPETFGRALSPPHLDKIQKNSSFSSWNRPKWGKWEKLLIKLWEDIMIIKIFGSGAVKSFCVRWFKLYFGGQTNIDRYAMMWCWMNEETFIVHRYIWCFNGVADCRRIIQSRSVEERCHRLGLGLSIGLGPDWHSSPWPSPHCETQQCHLITLSDLTLGFVSKSLNWTSSSVSLFVLNFSEVTLPCLPISHCDFHPSYLNSFFSFDFHTLSPSSAKSNQALIKTDASNHHHHLWHEHY